ncbi:MAG: hypothetical protein ACPGOV_06640 [Magnetovibrionaceae bacterium]
MSFDHTRGEALSRSPLNAAILATLLLTLCVFWLYTCVFNYLPFWITNQEYAYHTLGHGLNVDQWLFERGGRRHGFHQYMHPGVFYQIASWLAYRVSLLPAFPGAEAAFLAHIENPEPFQTTVHALTLLIGLLSAVLFWRLARGLDVMVRSAIALAPLSQAYLWYAGLQQMMPETFAVLVAWMSFAAGYRSFTTEQVAWKTLVVRFGLVGGAACFAYLIKLNYLPWAGALGAASVLWAALARPGWKQTAIAALAFIGGFALVFLIFCMAFLGQDQIPRMLSFHFSFFGHTGYQGAGEEGFMDFAKAWTAFLNGWRNLNFFAMLSWVLGFGALIVVALNLLVPEKRRAAEADPRAVCLLLFAGLGILLGMLAVLKHPGNNYLIAISALWPVMLLALGQLVGKTLLRATCALVLLVVAQAGFEAVRTHNDHADWARSRVAEVEKVFALPIEKGELRLWAFKVPSKPFIARHSVELSSVKAYRDVINRIFPEDQMFNIWRNAVRMNQEWHQIDDIPWRYAIVDRAYSREPKDIPRPFRYKGHEVEALDTIMIIKRAPAESPTEGEATPRAE